MAVRKNRNLSKAQFPSDEDRLRELQEHVEGLPHDHPHRRAYESAMDNARMSEREGIERYSPDWHMIVHSSYGSALADGEQ